MNVRFQSILVAAGEDDEGQLVFWGEHLAAVLVRLSAVHGEAEGRWFMEAAFGGLDSPTQPTFANLDEAQAWISAALHAGTSV